MSAFDPKWTFPLHANVRGQNGHSIGSDKGDYRKAMNVMRMGRTKMHLQMVAPG